MAVANPTDTVCPPAGHADCMSASPSSQEISRTRSLGKLLLAKLWKTLENVAGLMGDFLSLSVFLHVQIVLGHPSTLPRLSGKRGESFVKSGVAWSVEVLHRGSRSHQKTVLYLPCEEREQ